MIEGRLYDGVTGHPHRVGVAFAADGIHLSQAEGWSDEVGVEQLRRLDATPEILRLGRHDIGGWRLLLPADALSDVEQLLGKGERYGRLIDRVGLLPALVAGGILTAAVIAVGYVAPHWIAPHVPRSWERNVGTAIVGDFGNLRCRSSKGQRALETLVERVAPGSTRGPDAIKVAALDVPMFNAAALPGGYIVVFKPAITETEPEALAGIVAHEIAHVRRRHVTEALLRELGIGAVIRLFAGSVGSNAEQIVALSYTRDNEAQADGDAIAMLRRAGISPRPTAKLFRQLQSEAPAYSAEFLESHPQSGKRAARFEASFVPGAAYRPALDRDQQDALFDICRKQR